MAFDHVNRERKSKSFSFVPYITDYNLPTCTWHLSALPRSFHPKTHTTNLDSQYHGNRRYLDAQVGRYVDT